ncbi:MAG: peptide deformylase, partial [Sphingopyxis sp.]
MAILPIIETPDPRLRAISQPVTQFDDALKTLVADMLETMYDAPGIGLAAIQVGVAKRILVIDLQEPDPDDEEGKRLLRTPRVFINPVFSDESEEHSVYSEGC